MQLSKPTDGALKARLLLGVNDSPVNEWQRPKGWRSHFTEESEECLVNPLPSPGTFSAFGDSLLHGPGRAGREGGLPEPEPEREPEPRSVQLPTVWNPGGARSRSAHGLPPLTAGREGEQGGEEPEACPPFPPRPPPRAAAGAPRP